MSTKVPSPPLRLGRTSDDVSLAFSAEEFQTAGHRLVDRIAELRVSLPARPMTPGRGPEAVRDKLRASIPLPSKSQEASAVLEKATELLTENSLYNGHPSFFGNVTSSPEPIGMLAT